MIYPRSLYDLLNEAKDSIAELKAERQRFRDRLAREIRNYRSLQDKWSFLKTPADRAYYRGKLQGIVEVASWLREVRNE